MDILIEARDLNTGELLNSLSIPEEVHSQEIKTLIMILQLIKLLKTFILMVRPKE